ncbi:MAG: aminoglycoside phosphotransferase family protein [Chloroflexota bacterium]|nr:MAG: aminoglycoside phosphotransferase [Bellilinea sp.]
MTQSNQPIAHGRTAEIYEWQPGWILKLFHEWVDPQSIEYEAQISRAVHASGLPVPAVGERVQVNGRFGLLYQRAVGVPMWPEGLIRSPWKVWKYARQTAQLHAAIHNSRILVELPRQRQRLLNKIHQAESLPPQLRAKVLARLNNLPEGDCLCHGDFHPANILVGEEQAIVIDWVDATLGNPLADVARTTILALGAAACQMRGVFQKAWVRLFHATYLRHYFNLRPGGKQEYARWLPIVAAARLSENIPELEEWLIRQSIQGMKD